MRLNLKSLILIIMLCNLSIASAFAYIEGKNYQVIPNSPGIPSFPEKTINVTEFFSYGCPWCYQLESHLEQWLKNKPHDVIFERIPVVFERNWNEYAKAYYIATALDIDKKMTPKLFDAIQEKNQTLGTDSLMKAFFIKQGIKKETVDNAFEASPTLDLNIQQGVQLMHTYQVIVVPTIVIDGKYKTNLGMAANEKDFINIVQFLVAKRSAEKNKILLNQKMV